MTTDSAQFADDILAARAAAGLSQAQAAALLKVPRLTLISWERNRRTPKPITQTAALDILNRAAKPRPSDPA
ncbi:MAG: helix-turn-helix domain-containing protein [Oscillospiraceae bacterium]|jgi:DNA-binding transcriptional regulator YiaG|nr:helix-turn-helix domain-containing protein [Oscillospiraceae bacterium]